MRSVEGVCPQRIHQRLELPSGNHLPESRQIRQRIHLRRGELRHLGGCELDLANRESDRLAAACVEEEKQQKREFAGEHEFGVSLFVVRCSLFVVRCSLFVVRCSLFVVRKLTARSCRQAPSWSALEQVARGLLPIGAGRMLRGLQQNRTMIFTVFAASRASHYTIEARLDESAEELQGRARLVYTNRAPVALDTLWFHQHLNAFRPNSAWARRELSLGERRFQDLAAHEHAYERLTAVR
jgi:hypothetical protein